MGDEKALEFGLAAAAIKHTIPGDLNFISAEEVLNLMNTDAPDVFRDNYKKLT